LLSSGSFGFFDGNLATCYFFNFGGTFPSGGAFLLVELFFTQLRLYTVVEISFSLTTAAVLTCPLWWSFGSGIVCSHSNHGAVI